MLMKMVSIVCALLVSTMVSATTQDDRSQLSTAISSGDLTTVQSIFASSKMDIDQPSSTTYHESALVEAAIAANIPIIEYLVSQGAYIEGVSERKATPLTKLIQNGSSKLSLKELLYGIDFLVTSGADINQPGEKGYTPLMFACQYTRRAEIVEKILAFDPLINVTTDDEQTAFLLSLTHHNTQAFKQLVERGVNVHATHYGLTPLAMLASQGNIRMAKHLIEEIHPDVNEYDLQGATALCWAAYTGQSSMVYFLVEQGANINIKTTKDTHMRMPDIESFSIWKRYVTFPKGSTPLTFAKHSGGQPTVNVISDLGGIEFSPITPKEWTSWR